MPLRVDNADTMPNGADDEPLWFVAIHRALSEVRSHERRGTEQGVIAEASMKHLAGGGSDLPACIPVAMETASVTRRNTD